jgi:benzodiazapine receptor
MNLTWYDTLVKPSWTPAPGVIGTIWTILYPMILVVFGYIAFRVFKGDMPKALLVPIVINMVTNIAFTPIQFGLQNLPLATVDILLVLVTIVWAMIAFWPHSRIASLALIPYLVWVSTASVLQVTITLSNR